MTTKARVIINKKTVFSGYIAVLSSCHFRTVNRKQQSSSYNTLMLTVFEFLCKYLLWITLVPVRSTYLEYLGAATGLVTLEHNHKYQEWVRKVLTAQYLTITASCNYIAKCTPAFPEKVCDVTSAVMIVISFSQLVHSKFRNFTFYPFHK